MSFLHRLFASLSLLSLLLAGTGCGSKESPPPADATSSTTATTPDAAPAVPFVDEEGEKLVQEGWKTAKAKPLGDPRAIKGGALSYPIIDFPDNLRLRGSGHNTWLNYTITDLCYMSLLSMDPDTLEYLPGLASHWWISDDKMTYRFRIDPRARWSDGKPVVAEDVVATWSLGMDESTLEPSFVLTFGKLNKPIAKSPSIVEVTAKEQNWRNFLYFAGMAIMPAHQIGNLSGKEYLDQYNFAYTAFSGPYMVRQEDIKKGEQLIITRRTDWWKKDDPSTKDLYNFDKIRFLVVRDPELQFEKACKGEIDYFNIGKAEWWAKDLPGLEAVKKGHLVRQKIYTDAPNGISGFALNTRIEPLSDLNVRKALQHLLDRPTLIEKLAYNEYIPQNSYYAGGSYANPSNKPLEYDPATASKLLADAGFKDRGPDGMLVKNGTKLSLRLLYANPATEKYLTSFKETCRGVGVEIILDRTDMATLWKKLQERQFQMVSIQWGAITFPNPETSFHSRLADQKDNNNITGFKNARCDELFKQYDLAFEQAERERIIQEVDGIIYNEHPYVLWWYLPCQRVMYWNKFGMPDYGLHRTQEFEAMFSLWWVDPAKAEALKKARAQGTALPIPPLEVKYWDTKNRSMKAPTAN